ncbi:MAG TPA: hypothetical protein VG604_02500 [Candidatus Saccharimonadales bacterium]|nr:hypothetical protein [Candidatus Saccharimonadales bacterium]
MLNDTKEIFAIITLMRKKLLIAITLCGLLLLIGILFVQKRNTGTLEITGRIEAIDNGCNLDAECSITLDDGSWIITDCGLTTDAATCNNFDQSKLRIGQTVRARVHKVSNDKYDIFCAGCGIYPE